MKLYHTIEAGNKKLELKVEYNEEDREYDYLISAVVSDGKNEMDITELLDWQMIETIDWEAKYKEHLELKAEASY